jgi:hypothetical protein
LGSVHNFGQAALLGALETLRKKLLTKASEIYDGTNKCYMQCRDPRKAEIKVPPGAGTEIISAPCKKCCYNNQKLSACHKG